jgi:hypothetical protein
VFNGAAHDSPKLQSTSRVSAKSARSSVR